MSLYDVASFPSAIRERTVRLSADEVLDRLERRTLHSLYALARGHDGMVISMLPPAAGHETWLVLYIAHFVETPGAVGLSGFSCANEETAIELTGYLGDVAARSAT